MNAGRIVWSIVGLLSFSLTARGGSVAVYTDLETFRAAAGPLVEIDFSTLPDGTPSPLDVPRQITPEFNYTNLGVTFSSHEPELLILGHSQGGGTLYAVSGKSTIRNWIEAEFAPDVYAVAITMGGGNFLSVFDSNDNFLAEAAGGPFLGMISDLPINLALIDHHDSGVAITSILFDPVPEPVTLLLFGAGVFFVARRRWAHKT